jgi:hypothetical protein
MESATDQEGAMINGFEDFVKYFETTWQLHAIFDLWVILSIFIIVATKVDKE